MITPLTIAQSFFATVFIIAGVLALRLGAILLLRPPGDHREDEE